MKYTVEEILKAAEIGEVSMIDAKHIVGLLREAKELLVKEKLKDLVDGESRWLEQAKNRRWRLDETTPNV